MCKQELFKQTAESVAEATEIALSRILSDDTAAEIVDARHLLIRILVYHGLYPSEVARLMHCSRRTVSYVITNFDERLARSWVMRRAWEAIGKQYGNG